MEPWLEDRGVDARPRLAAGSTASGACAAGDETLVARRAVVVATGTDALVPPIDGLRRGRAVDQPRGHDRQARRPSAWSSSAAAWSAWSSRRRGARSARGDAGRGAATGCSPARSRSPRGRRAGAARARRRRAHWACSARRVTRETAARSRSSSRRASRARRRAARRDRAHAATRRTSASRRVGLEPGKPIAVDDLHARAATWLYAIGDVNGRALLTHMGKYQARCAADTILGAADSLPLVDGEPLAARDLHRPPGGRGRLHARRRAGGRAERRGSST